MFISNIAWIIVFYFYVSEIYPEFLDILILSQIALTTERVR
jgi:hypothetical protein